MRHIPTSATTLRRIKAEAKKRKVSSNIPLAQALHVAATDAGYENYHHLIQCAKLTSEAKRGASLGALVFDVLPFEWRVHGTQETPEGRFWIADAGAVDVLESVTEELDYFLDTEGDILLSDDSFTALPSDHIARLEKFVALCEKLTRKSPAFLDGYAHWVGVLVRLGRFEQATIVGQPVFTAACALIPDCFKGLVSYSELSNRPFHRLASNLALSYIRGGDAGSGQKIARKMLRFWPNDNIGFRFYLPEDAWPKHVVQLFEEAS